MFLPPSGLDIDTTNEERERVRAIVWPGPSSETERTNLRAFIANVEAGGPSPTFSQAEREAVMAALAKVKAERP